MNEYRSDAIVTEVLHELKPVNTTGIKTEEKKVDSVEENHRFRNEKSSLEELNEEYRFWISISNTNIDYPVVQGKDNQFYLKHDFFGDKNLSGTIFIDAKNNMETDMNLILYGHNMKNNTMFSEIIRLRDEEKFRNSEIRVINEGEEIIYKPIAVYVEKENRLNLMSDFETYDDYVAYINYIRKKSEHYNAVEINKPTELLTLITCSYEFKNARTVVHALREIK